MDYISDILLLSVNPSTKVILICLSINEEPMTTAELNASLNLKKTFENYKTALKEQLDNGSVKLVSMKAKNGIKRWHFELDIEKLIEE